MLRRAITSWTLGMLASLFLPISPLPAVPSKPVPPQAFLRVNGLYFLYTYPVVPYLDKSGALMVGLAGAGRGLFTEAPPGDPDAYGWGGDDHGRAIVDAAARTETLALGGHTLTFRAGTATARVDGKEVPLEAAAAWDAPTRQMVVPAQGLAQCLGLPARWDAQRRVLSLTGPPTLTRHDTNVTSGYPLTLDATTMTPARTTLHPNDAPPDAYYVTRNPDRRRLPWLMIEMRNVSGAVAETYDLNAAILYSDEGNSGHLGGEAGRRHTLVPPEGVWRYPLSLQKTLDGAIPFCVVSYPVTAVP